MKIKNILNGQSKTITGAAFIIGITGLLSRLIGLLRDRILAGQFGAGDILDAYYAAFKIPDLVYNLIVVGALSAGFIPVFVKIYFNDKKQDEAWKFVNNLLNIITLGLTILAGIFILIMPLLAPVIAPGFTGEKLTLTIGLSRIMFLGVIFWGISNILGGVLQSFKRFFVYSLAPSFYNIGIIIGALFFVPRWGAYGLALGVVFGVILNVLVQLPGSYHLGYRFALLFDFKNLGFRKITRMMLPRTLSLAVAQINLVFMTIIASLLASGSLTIFNLANNLQGFPVGVFGVSFAIAAFPTLSSLANISGREEFAKNFSNTAREILFFIIPFTILFIALRAQIVRTVLGSGRFNWENTVLTADALALFSISMFAQALWPLLVRAFFAFQDTKTPFYVGLASVGANIVLGWYFSTIMGVAGLALAFSLSSILDMLALWLILRKRIDHFDGRNIGLSTLKFLTAGFFMAVFIQGMKYLVEPIFGTETFVGIFLQGLTAGLAGLIVYVIICFWLKSPEMIVFWNSWRRRIFKKVIPEISSVSDGEEI